MKNHYFIVYPVFGSAGTRNPTHEYLPVSSEDKGFMLEVLKNRKKENPKLKRAFLATYDELKKLINYQL